MKQIIVIPARMRGTRLPGKPMIDIAGKPMIKHVWDRAINIHDREKVFIATEDKIIKNFCEKNNMNCVITGAANTAIERIKLFSDVIEADSYINLQGDEPIINLKDLKTILDYNMKFPKRIVFGKSTCNQEEFDDFSKAKVVCDLNNKLLYSSRAGIPINNKGNFIKAQRAIWLYAFTKESLNKYYEYKKGTPLEIIEDNEIIRFLEIGIDVYCVDMIGDSWAVDEKKDIEIVIQKIKDV
tara:strand:+ start:1921 stop:2640 length:720 start_codon:yes stop_codon:yes gene_type:complete